MTKILLISDNFDSSHKLGNQLEENYLLEVVYSQNYHNIIDDYLHEAPDLILLHYNESYLGNEVEQIIELDATACIVAMMDQEHEQLIPFAYKSGVRSVIKTYSEITDQNVTKVANQIVSICNMVQRNGKCKLCWKETKFTDKYHEQKTMELTQS